ncbi:MAG: MFS transporter [Deltaproteobacteria bacterium]|nr:MFS transporter [Deltaproteobacteria bacterium]
MKKQGDGEFKRHRFMFYGWFVVIVGGISHALGYGARYSFAVIFPSLLEEFRWPRDTTAAMLSMHMLVYGLVAPAAGYLVDRTGPRKTMVLGVTLLSLGLILSRWGSEPGHFFLSFGVLSGAGLCLIGSVPFTTVVRNWFERKRGLAFSLMFFGSGGAFAFYPAIAGLIDLVGWRNTFMIEGLVLAGIMIPLIVLVVRYHPMDKGLVRDGHRPEEDFSPAPTEKEMQIMDPAWAAVDWTFSKAVRTKRFWFLALTIFCLWGVMEPILVVHHVACAIDAGYSKIYASSVLSLFGVMFAFGSLAGLVSDRIGRELTLTIGTLIGISGIVVLMFIKDTSHPWMLYYYALSLGFGIGICGPAISAAITDIFQGPQVGFVIGSVWFCFAIGGTIGPWLGGWLFELKGNYWLALLVAIFFYALAGVAIWLAAPRKVRRVTGRRAGGGIV